MAEVIVAGFISNCLQLSYYLCMVFVEKRCLGSCVTVYLFTLLLKKLTESVSLKS